jgi:hypothetical protein
LPISEHFLLVLFRWLGLDVLVPMSQVCLSFARMRILLLAVVVGVFGSACSTPRPAAVVPSPASAEAGWTLVLPGERF